MVRIVSAVVIAAYIAAAITLLPSFSPVAAAAPTSVGQKGDRLPIRSVTAACAAQNWPNIDVSCLRSGSRHSIQPARLVTSDRS